MRKYLLVWVIGLIGLAAMPGDAFAFSGGCGFRPLPLVRVDVRESPVVINHQKSRAELTALPNNTVLRLPGAEAVSGLTSNPINASADFSFDSESSMLGGESCLWLTTLTIRMTSAPEIAIARELPENSCQYRALLRHEQKHVALDRALLKDFSARIEPVFRDLAREMAIQGPLPSGMMHTAQNTTSQRINLRLRSELARFEHDRNRKQQALDTLAEYEAVARECP